MSLSTGCDDSRASDKQMYQTIEESRSVAEGEEGAVATIRKLEEAIAIDTASPAGKAHAASMLAQAEQAEAMRLVDGFAEGQRNALRLISEITGIGAQIDLVNAQVSFYQQGEPTQARELAQTQTAEVQGAADKAVWFEHADASIPTLAAVRQNISRLQGEVTKQQEQVKGLQEQRAQALAQAEQLQQKSENETGDTAVETYREASAARKKAADLQTQIDSITATIVPLERDLAVAQGQDQAASVAVETYKALIDSMDQGWENVQQQVAASQQLGASLVGTSGATPAEGEATPATINAKAEELAAQMERNQQTFDTVEQYLNNAIKHFQDATAAATSYSTSVELPPGVDRNSKIGKTTDLSKTAMNPAGFKLNEAQARQTLATLHTSRALVLNTLMRMSDALKLTLDASALEMPESLGTEKVESDLEHSKDMANTGYEEAATLYTDASSASLMSQERKNVATVGLALARYGQAQVARISDKTAEAEQFLAEARSARDAAIENGASLPAMPPELVPPPTTRPATAPTTAAAAPSTTPAEGAAPVEGSPPAEEAAPAAPADGTAPAEDAAPTEASPPAEGTVPPEAVPPADGAAAPDVEAAPPVEAEPAP